MAGSFNNFFNGDVTCGGWLNESYSADTWKLPITNPSGPSYLNINIPNSNNGGVFAAGLAAIIGVTPCDEGFYQYSVAEIDGVSQTGASWIVDWSTIQPI